MESRLDIAIKKKFNFSREYSKEIIFKGYVYINGKVICKPSFKVNICDKIELNDMAIPKYVSRGGFKLEKALREFSIEIKNKVCIDIGSSTGGFTDCMIQNNANKVYAIDVGTNQLSKKLLNCKNIIPMQNTDIRNICISDFKEKIEFISIDVSFISVKKILKNVFSLIDKDGELIILIKPQFEIGKQNIYKRGIVKNKNVHIKILEDIIDFSKQIGLYVYGLTFSPIKGSKGNIEYLTHMKKQKCEKDFLIKEVVFKAFEQLK